MDQTNVVKLKDRNNGEKYYYMDCAEDINYIQSLIDKGIVIDIEGAVLSKVIADKLNMYIESNPERQVVVGTVIADQKFEIKYLNSTTLDIARSLYERADQPNFGIILDPEIVYSFNYTQNEHACLIAILYLMLNNRNITFKLKTEQIVKIYNLAYSYLKAKLYTLDATSFYIVNKFGIVSLSVAEVNELARNRGSELKLFREEKTVIPTWLFGNDYDYNTEQVDVWMGIINAEKNKIANSVQKTKKLSEYAQKDFIKE